MILDPIMLITGIQSDYGPRGELVVLNCEVLEDSRRFLEFFRAFHGISERSGSRHVPVVV